MATIQQKIRSLGPWYHQVNIGGHITPGKVDPSERIDLCLSALPPSIDGASVIDLGGNCGSVGIELAKRGARVTVLELGGKFIEQGRWMSDYFSTPVEFVQGEIYQLPELGRFDFVLFLGLIYHLRHPFLALDMVRNATTERLVFSSRINPSTHRVWSAGNVVTSPRAGGESAYNWWLPSTTAVEGSLEAYGFRDVERLLINDERSEGFWTAVPGKQIAVRDLARAATRGAPKTREALERILHSSRVRRARGILRSLTGK